jgi:hypothetical protein
MTHRSRLTAAIILLAVVGAHSCRPDARAIPVEIEEYYEEGSRIVVHPGLQIADERSRRFGRSPTVRIGGLDGAEEYTFGSIAGVLRQRDGSILVGDAMANELRLYDEAGHFIRRVGGAGRGPGEYRSLSGVLPFTADSVLVIDETGTRVNVLTPELRYARSHRIPSVASGRADLLTSHSVLAAFSDGSLLVGNYLDACPEVLTGGGFCEDSVGFYRTDLNGRVLAQYGSFVISRTRHGVVRRGFGVQVGEPYPQAFWAVHDDRFYYADGQRFEVRVHGPDGNLEMVSRVAHVPPRYGRKEAFHKPEFQAPAPVAEQARRVLEELHARAPLPDTFPAISDLHVDDAGNIWLREYLPRTLMPRRLPRWFVFDPQGRLQYALRSPPELAEVRELYQQKLLHIGVDHALAAVRDRNGVPAVVVYTVSVR